MTYGIPTQSSIAPQRISKKAESVRRQCASTEYRDSCVGQQNVHLRERDVSYLIRGVVNMSSTSSSLGVTSSNELAVRGLLKADRGLGITGLPICRGELLRKALSRSVISDRDAPQLWGRGVVSRSEKLAIGLLVEAEDEADVGVLLPGSLLMLRSSNDGTFPFTPSAGSSVAGIQVECWSSAS